MEPGNRGNFDLDGNSAPKAPKQTSKVFNKIKKILKKYWYIFAALLILIAAGVTIVVLESNKAAAWTKASDYFATADYEKSANLIKDFPVPSDPEKQRVYAQTMLATGELDKALAGYEALYDSTKDSSAKLIIGNIYNQKEQYDKAIDIYREIIADNASNVQAYVNLATVYRLQGKNDDAIAIATEAVQKNPKNVTLLELKVSMLMEKNTSDEYKKAIEELKAIAPDDPLLQALNQ